MPTPPPTVAADRRPLAGRLRLAGLLAAGAVLAVGGIAGATTAPVSTVPATATATVPATTATGPASSVAADPFAEVAAITEQYVRDHELTGAGLVIVDRDRGVVWEGYFGEFSADRVSFVASSSKMITAGVLLHLADEGLLDIDAPVASYLDWDGNPEITVAQLLSNSSGLVGLGPDPAYAPYVCQFVGTELEECATTIFTTPDDDADVIAPDTQFRYGGGQWQVAGGIAETVSGKPWAELIDEIYVQPCGVDSLGYGNHWLQHPSGYPVGVDPTAQAPTENPHMEGGVFITAPDYAELLLMHLRDGDCAGGNVLSPAALAAAHGDRLADAWDGVSDSPDQPLFAGYGLGWFVARDGSGVITDPGAYGSVPWLELDEGFGAYLVVEADTETGVGLAEQLFTPVHDAVLATR